MSMEEQQQLLVGLWTMMTGALPAGSTPYVASASTEVWVDDLRSVLARQFMVGWLVGDQKFPFG